MSFSQNSINNKERLTYNQLKDSIRKYSKTDTEKAISFSKNYIHKAQQEENIKEEFNGHYFQSQVYFQNDDLKQAFSTSTFCVDFSKVNSLNVELIKSFLLRGLIKSENSEWSDLSIIEDYSKALRLSKDIDDFYWTHTTLGRLSAFYTISGEIEKAIKIQKETINALKEVENEERYKQFKKWGLNIRDYYNYITKAYIIIKKADSAKFYNELFYKKLYEKDKLYHYWKREFYISEGGINLLKEDYTLAREHFINAYKDMPSDEKERRKFQEAYHLGSITFKEKKYKESISILESVINEISTTSGVDFIFYNNYYKYLAQAYLHINNFETANYYLEKQLKSISKNNNFKNSIKSKFKEIEIEEYNKELQLVKTENKKQSYLIIFISFLFIVGVTGSFFYNRNLKKKNKQKFNTLIQKFENTEKVIETTAVDLKPKLEIKDSKIQTILEGLKLLEQKRYFLNIDCSLSSIAKEINTNTSYLSKIINSLYEKSFNAYINELRINYAIQRLKTDRLFRRYTIESIANEIGFKSKESFNKAFRNQTGILPSFYIKQLELAA